MQKERKVYEILDTAITARSNLRVSDIVRTEWENKWDDLIQHLEKNYLPSGSGFDAGTHVIEEECVPGLKIVLNFGYHHMDEHGYYDGWSHHKAIIIPYFDGIGIKLKGALPRKYRHSKEYFIDTLHTHLTSHILTKDIDRILGVVRPA